MYAGTGSNTGMRLAEQLGLQGLGLPDLDAIQAQSGTGSSFWDKLYNIAKGVADVAPHVASGVRTVQGVVQGDSKIAVVPQNGMHLVYSSGQYPVGGTLPPWVLPVAAAGALFLILRR